MRSVVASLVGIAHASSAPPSILATLLEDGLTAIATPSGVPTATTDLRTFIGDSLRFLVTFLGLVAIVTIIIAGFLLVVGLGTEQSKERAKKIILYTSIGLLVIFFVGVIITFFTVELPAHT